ncbi:MAG: acetyl-CoA carboxylase biotin carboxyl carrier protein [Chthoniobacterales bacterium]
MELKEIRQLIDLMKKNGLAVFKMEKEGFKITLQTEAGNSAPIFHSYQPPAHAPASLAPAPAVSAPASESKSTELASNEREIISPMVGTFYSAASPDSPAYLEVGQEVTPETVVCIIEAMKVMNEIKAEVSGKVVAVLAENGKPVQFGQALYRIKVS